MPRFIFQFYLDAPGLGVAENISQQLTADAIDFVAEDRVQGSRSPFDDDTEIDLIRDCQFLRNPGKRLLQIDKFRDIGAENSNYLVSLLDELPYQFLNTAQMWLRFRILRQTLDRDVELQGRADKALQ
jgi:hypothetical protein